MLCNTISGSIILDLYSQDHFEPTIALIKTLFKHSQTKTKIGISLHTNSRYSIQNFQTILNEFNQLEKQRIIIRLTKGNHWVYNEHNEQNNFASLAYKQSNPIKMNTTYKWTIYTMFKLITNDPIQCHINNHNLYDIAWSLLLRNQLKISHHIHDETDIIKFPNISKILHILTQTGIHSETILLENSPIKDIQFILKKLINQGTKYNHIVNTNLTAKEIFLTSHKRFFKYLENNYLTKYSSFISNLNKQSSTTLYKNKTLLLFDETISQNIKTAATNALKNTDLTVHSSNQAFNKNFKM